jgi:hypothetical protein
MKVSLYDRELQIMGPPLSGLVARVPGYRSRDPGFDSRRYQIFWEVVGLERGLERLEWKSSGSGSRKPRLGRGYPMRWPRDTLYPQKLVLTSPTCGGPSVGIVHLQTKATEFSFSSKLCRGEDFQLHALHIRLLSYINSVNCIQGQADRQTIS